MDRYLFLLRNEVATMRAARQARSFGRGTTWNRWKVSAQLIGMLLIRGMRRADRVHRAMNARGYNGEVRLLDD
jgi:cobalt/nickel transport system permease protein